jgi:hypothetical protein
LRRVPVTCAIVVKVGRGRGQTAQSVPKRVSTRVP